MAAPRVDTFLVGTDGRRMRLQAARHAVGAALHGELRAPRRCSACGRLACGRRRPAINDRLAAEWELSPAERRAFDEREGYACVSCLSSRRAQALATAVTRWANDRFGTAARSLADVVRTPQFRAISVAEVNPCGGLHAVLAAKPDLAFSDYGDPERSEDFQALSYGDASFDLMLSSETLEHVPDLDATLGEIRRVLKPGATHLFTVPVRWDRPTRIRRTVDGTGRAVALLPDSFHGRVPKPDRVVYREFGADVCERLSIPRLRCTVAPPSSPDTLVVLAQVRREGPQP